MKKNDIRHWSTEKITHTLLYIITGVVALVFLLFYLVGYDAPAFWDEKYNCPVLTDLVIALMFILLISAFGVVAYSKVHSLRTNHTSSVVNGIHGKRITWGVIAMVIVFMAITCVAFPSHEMLINGVLYTDTLWLHVATMFVTTCIALICVGIAVIVFGIIKNKRKR